MYPLKSGHLVNQDTLIFVPMKISPLKSRDISDLDTLVGALPFLSQYSRSGVLFHPLNQDTSNTQTYFLSPKSVCVWGFHCIQLGTWLRFFLNECI